ncbi:hypothetical protein [Empedobacter brevis]|uniref:Uncharacterized protein n=1 Tax=Empedobacter brevis NBRC 14943 = ATCC 43319 TaxID=1218108 RepID=A0A511NLP3_9FLAO|nr:hypothetical protein [Empedobacter brevis]GEM53710.1 hypothetical protein EB1_35000 [Empedobacter brevis NBRC 14943 = ATCC 43319]
MKNLTLLELQNIDGGCAKCKATGKKIGKAIKDALLIDEITDAWNELWD